MRRLLLSEKNQEITTVDAQPIQEAPLEDVDLVRYAERKMEQLNKLVPIIVKRTYSQDWIDLQGKPWLGDTGAERIMPLFGICVEIREPGLIKEEMKDEKGSYVIYRVYGRASIQGRTPLDVSGSCSSRKKFFAYAHGKDKPQSEVDMVNIQNDAISDLYRNAVVRLLGLRNLTWEQLEAAGIKRGVGGKVEYNSAPKKAPAKKKTTKAMPKDEPEDGVSPGALFEGDGEDAIPDEPAPSRPAGKLITDKQRKRAYAISKSNGWSDDQFKDKLIEFGYSSSKDITMDAYDDICAYFEEKSPE
jgi:hypothetical protein